MRERRLNEKIAMVEVEGKESIILSHVRSGNSRNHADGLNFQSTRNLQEIVEPTALLSPLGTGTPDKRNGSSIKISMSECPFSPPCHQTNILSIPIGIKGLCHRSITS
jgi:hypothetical protein